MMYLTQAGYYQNVGVASFPKTVQCPAQYGAVYTRTASLWRFQYSSMKLISPWNFACIYTNFNSYRFRGGIHQEQHPRCQLVPAPLTLTIPSTHSMAILKAITILFFLMEALASCNDVTPSLLEHPALIRAQHLHESIQSLNFKGNFAWSVKPFKRL